ncbi:MAG: hypothetical protein QME12_02465 [Nanoarchaeota archaeon]|nr:hypothetical protein [Nanoarchaeota archaeon]
MTVGLVLNNKDYGVALADSMVTIGDYRKGDTANKLLHINAKDFYGAMVGAGDAINIFAAFEHIKDKTFKEPKTMLEEVRNFSLEYQLNIDRQALESQMKIEELAKKYRGNPEDSGGETEDEEDNGEGQENDIFGFKRRKKAILGGIEDYMTSDFVTAIYDKKEQRVRKYFINAAIYAEDPIFETVIGSGADSAGLELARLISGAPLNKLHQREIAFFGLCAYVRATQNIGVGGIPKIALIDKEGSKIVSREDSIALANITAAYHADLLPRAYAEHNAELVLRGRGKYEKVAQAVGMNEFALKNHLVPLDSWLNLANNLRYSPKQCKCGGKCRKGKEESSCKGDCKKGSCKEKCGKKK